MTQPPYLKSGDTIAIVATARKVSKTEMEHAIAHLKNSGFQVLEAPNLYADDNQFAGVDEIRASDLQWAIENPEVKAILCARGGYGSIRILDKVDFSSLKQNAKWIAGFSDITVLLSHLEKNLGIMGLHSPMAIHFTPDRFEENSIQKLMDALTGNHHPVNAASHDFNRQGKAKGKLVGGNLSIVFSAMGTPYDINTDGNILFLEDLDEYLYHIDRMMMSLKSARKLSNLKGLIIGSMSDMNDNTIPFGRSAVEIIRDAVDTFEYPVAYNFPCGHERKNYPLVIGGDYQLEVLTDGATLSLN